MTTDIRNFLTERLRAMKGYVPGLQLNDKSILKLNTNENPFPLPHSAITEIEQSLHQNRLQLYPNPDSAKLRHELGEIYECGAESVFIGNGSDEILRLVFQAFTEPGESSITALDPSYSLYSVLAQMVGAELDFIPLKDDFTADLNLMLRSKSKLAVITNPNAPTGIELNRATLIDFLEKWNRPLLVDEAYTAFGSQSLMKKRHPLLMVCGTFSKAYSLAGMRIGWLIADSNLIAELDKLRDSYNVSYLAQECALAALRHLPIIEEHIQEICRVRDRFSEALTAIGYTVLPSNANFVFVRPPNQNGKQVYDYLYNHGVLVRHFSQERLQSFIRISIGTDDDMQRVIELLMSGSMLGHY